MAQLMRMLIIALLISIFFSCTGCASYQTTLTNMAGQKYNCSADGYGVIGATMAAARMNSCVAKAKEIGYN